MRPAGSGRDSARGSERVLLGLASVAVAFAAADTYVVVLALPDMMTSVGVEVVQLQKAAPIVSGFLLGYVAMLPLIGRIADLRGRLPVLVMALVVFALGSLITALAYDMPSIVTGRFLQGVGGGGLVPATLALVADLYPVQRRGVPARRRLGGPGDRQRHRPALRCAGALGGRLAGDLPDQPGRRPRPRRRARTPSTDPRPLVAEQRAISRDPSRDPTSSARSLLLVALRLGVLVFTQPRPIMQDLTWGRLFIPFAGDGRWLTPVGAVAIVAAVLFVVRCLTARRPLVDLRGWGRSMREADLPGALLLAVALSGVILAFATADPKIQVFSDQGVWYLLGGAVAAALFVRHQRRTAAPLVPRGALTATPAWGSLVVSFFIGAALIAALIDIPLFARTTVYPDSQLQAALVLVRFLVALPVGAVIGGYLTRRLPAGVVTAAGMVLAAVGFLLMSRWDLTSLEQASASIAARRRRLRLRPRPGAGQRGRAGHDRRRRARAQHGARRRVADGRHARRHLGPHDARAAVLLRRAGRRTSRPRGLRRQEPVQGVHAAAQGGGHRPGADGVPGRGGLRPRRGDPRAPALPSRRDPGSRRGRPAAGRRLSRASVPVVGHDFDDLLAANRDYAAAFDGGDFDGVAHAGVAIVTCMDSRIDPLRMLGLRHGDAKIFRNPGGRVSADALEALVLGVHLLGVERVLVVPHTRCAMTATTEAELRDRVGASAGVDASWQQFHVIDDQLAALTEDVRKVSRIR